MSNVFSKKALLSRMKELSDWLQMSAATASFDLVVVGEAALVLTDAIEEWGSIDLFQPQELSPMFQRGIAIVARANRMEDNWINTATARRLADFPPPATWPDYLDQSQSTLRVGKNIVIRVASRQTLISLLLLVTTRNIDVHLNNLLAIDPTMHEIDTALQFVRSVDNSTDRTADFRFVLSKLAFSRETMEGLF